MYETSDHDFSVGRGPEHQPMGSRLGAWNTVGHSREPHRMDIYLAALKHARRASV